MAEGFIQLSPDNTATGKQLDTDVVQIPAGTIVTDGGGNQTTLSAPAFYFRERIVNADPNNPAGIATVTQAPQPGDFGLTTRFPAGQSDLQAMIALLLDIDTVLNQMAGQGVLGASGANTGMQAVRGPIHGPPVLSPNTPYPVLADGFGRLVIGPSFGRNQTDANSTTITAATETTIQAGDPNNFLDLMAIIISNTSATAVRVDIRDQPSTVVAPPSTLGVMPFYVPAGDMRGISFSTPNYQSNINQAWTATVSSAVTDIRVWALWAQTPRGY
jgi:hypothetical protein